MQAKKAVVNLLRGDLYRVLERNGLMETNTRFLFTPRGSPAGLDDAQRFELWSRIVKIRKNAMIYTVVAAILVVMQTSATMVSAVAIGKTHPALFLPLCGVFLVVLGIRTLWCTARHLDWLAGIESGVSEQGAVPALAEARSTGLGEPHRSDGRPGDHKSSSGAHAGTRT
jgi:hypothetical protein